MTDLYPALNEVAAMAAYSTLLVMLVMVKTAAVMAVGVVALSSVAILAKFLVARVFPCTHRGQP
jgi:hypothetical protein